MDKYDIPKSLTKLQKDLVADLLETYYNEHIKKTNDVDEFFYHQCKVAFEYGEEARVEGLIDRIIEQINHDFILVQVHKKCKS